MSIISKVDFSSWALRLVYLMDISVESLGRDISEPIIQNILKDLQKGNLAVSSIQYFEGHFSLRKGFDLTQEDASNLFNMFKELLVGNIYTLKRDEILSCISGVIYRRCFQEGIDFFIFMGSSVWELIANKILENIPESVSSDTISYRVIRLRTDDAFFDEIRIINRKVQFDPNTCMSMIQVRDRILCFMIALEELGKKKLHQIVMKYARKYGFSGFEFLLIPSKSYFIKETESEGIFTLFRELMSVGFQGLVISRKPPTVVKEKYYIHKCQIFWLNRLEADDCINPGDLMSLVEVIDTFSRRSRNGVILLEGLEYLVILNGIKEILSTLEEIKNIVKSQHTSLIFSIGRYVLDNEEIALLEEGTEKVIF